MKGKHTVNIPGELASAASNGVVASADGIYDYNQNKSQEDINAETVGRLNGQDQKINTKLGEIDQKYGEFEDKTDEYFKEESAKNKEQIQQGIAGVAAIPNNGVEFMESLPATGVANKIYRVPDEGGHSYADYSWNGSAFVPLARFDYGVDDEPTAGSKKLVTSNGVFEKIADVDSKVINEYTGTLTSNERAYEFRDFIYKPGETYYLKLIEGDAYNNLNIGIGSLPQVLNKTSLNNWVKVDIPTNAVPGKSFLYILGNFDDAPKVLITAEGNIKEIQNIENKIYEKLDKEGFLDVNTNLIDVYAPQNDNASQVRNGYLIEPKKSSIYIGFYYNDLIPFLNENLGKTLTFKIRYSLEGADYNNVTINSIYRNKSEAGTLVLKNRTIENNFATIAFDWIIPSEHISINTDIIYISLNTNNNSNPVTIKAEGLYLVYSDNFSGNGLNSFTNVLKKFVENTAKDVCCKEESIIAGDLSTEYIEGITDITVYGNTRTFSLASGNGSIWYMDGDRYSISQYQRHTNKIPVTPGEYIQYTGAVAEQSNGYGCNVVFFGPNTNIYNWDNLSDVIKHYNFGTAVKKITVRVPEGAAYAVICATSSNSNPYIIGDKAKLITKEPEVVTITADRDENSGADFTGLTAIADAIDSIKDASYSKRYRIKVNGVFHFTDPKTLTMFGGSEYSAILMKPYVDIEGNGLTRSVIFVDFPKDAVFHDGKTYFDYQPVYFYSCGGTLSNMKIMAKNCRYGIHIENSRNGGLDKVINIENCDVISYNSPDYGNNLNAFGTGICSGQTWNIKNCNITNINPSATAFAMHSPLAVFDRPPVVNFENCRFKGAVGFGHYTPDNFVYVNMVGCTFANGGAEPTIGNSYYNDRGTPNKGDYTGILLMANDISALYKNNVYSVGRGFVLRVISKSTGVSSNVRFDETSSAFGMIIGDSSISNNDKTLYGWDTQYGVVYRDGGIDLSGQAFGTIDIDETSYSKNSLGKLLGDCSINNKQLGITIDGAKYTVTFNEDYSSRNNSYVIDKINSIIGRVATADTFSPANLYYPTINGLCEVESVDDGAIMKGMGVIFTSTGMRRAKNSDGFIDGICLDDTSKGQTGRVITNGFIYNDKAAQWFKAKDTLTGLQYNKTLGVDPDNDGTFKLDVTPAVLRCKTQGLELIR